MIKTQNLDLICIKFHQKNKKPKNRNFGLLRFLSLKKLKNIDFSKPFSSRAFRPLPRQFLPWIQFQLHV